MTLVGFLLLIAVFSALCFRGIWLHAKRFDEALHQALHAAFVRFSLDSQ